MGQVYFKVVFYDVSTLISNFVVVSSVTLLYCFVARYSLPFYVMTSLLLEKGAEMGKSHSASNMEKQCYNNCVYEWLYNFLNF